eukprot:m.287544 g.287544  ORF g.287544 m.287544 type:complete len:217 (-) comp19949_c0_seq2:705-1355(-)
MQSGSRARPGSMGHGTATPLDLRVPDEPTQAETERYWNEEEAFTPEARVEAMARAAKERARAEEKKNPKKKKKKKRKNFFHANGRALNMNESGLGFALNGQMDNTVPLVLELSVYKYLDTSQIDLDVQPQYVRATIKDKVFQLCLPEEISPDASKAERSKITGHLVVTMPKVNQEIVPTRVQQQKQCSGGDADLPRGPTGRELLEVDASVKPVRVI